MAEVAEKGKVHEIQEAKPARALSPLQEMERVMERMFEGFAPGWFPSRWERPAWRELAAAPFEGKVPTVDVVDREEEVVVRAELPGVEKKDLDVTMSDNTVTIKGTVKHEEKEEKGDYYRREISEGCYARTVMLPAEVDGSKAKAQFKDGMLELTLPKVEKSKRRSIAVE
jgi:HSP20 family protein